jgi:GPH family glycoside/pentoside/hexuronide:cation symporter
MAEVTAVAAQQTTVVAEAPIPAATAATGSRPTFQQKSVYAVGDVADGLKNAAINYFLLFYLTAVLGLPGWLAAVASTTALIVDAVLDPLIGYISDNTKSKWGRRHPYMLGAGIPFSLALGLLYSIPLMGSTWATFAYALAVLLVVRVAYSTFGLPYFALGAELARDYTERSMLMTFRTFFNIAGRVMAVYLGFYVFLAGEKGNLVHANYVPYGWVCAAIVLTSILLATFGTRNMRHLMYETQPASDRFSPRRIFSEFIEIFRNHSFVILFVTIVTFWVSQGAALFLTVHVLNYFWELPHNIVGLIPMMQILGDIIGIPVAGVVLRYMEKRDVSVWGLGIFCVCQLVPISLGLLGLMPAGPTLYIILCCFAVVIGICGTCVLISFGSMMMDAADEHEFLFGSRREGLYFAGLIFSIKCAVGIGFLLAGLALDIIGFPQGIANNPNQVIPEGTIRSLGLVAGPGAAILAFTAVIVLTRYKLLKTKLHQIQADLASRSSSLSRTFD